MPKLGKIVHISIDDVRLKSPHTRDGFVKVIHHMPFADDALRGSLLNVESTVTELPDYLEGYSGWKEAFEHEDAGVWTMPVADAVDALEEILSQ